MQFFDFILKQFWKDVFFINLYEIFNSIDNTLEKNIKSYDNSFVDKFIDELKEFLLDRRDISRLNQMPNDTIFKITDDTKDYFVTMIDLSSRNLPKLDGIADNIFYIPKNICDLNINENLYKNEDMRLEEVKYKNYLQLKDGIYKVVDKNGNVLK